MSVGYGAQRASVASFLRLGADAAADDDDDGDDGDDDDDGGDDDGDVDDDDEGRGFANLPHFSQDLGNSASNSVGDDIIQSFRSKRDSQRRRATGEGSDGGRAPPCLWWERQKRKEFLGEAEDGEGEGSEGGGKSETV